MLLAVLIVTSMNKEFSLVAETTKFGGSYK